MSKHAAFVTGGSSGVGLELAKQLAARGHPVAIFSRNENRLRSAVEAIHEAVPGVTVAPFPADVGDRAACEAAVARAIEALGEPGWAIACAGIAEPGLFLDQDTEAHERHLRTNYLGALYFARAVARPLGQTKGHLVFVGSGAALFGIAGYSAYAPSKFALRGLAEVLRVELAPSGVAVSHAYLPDTDTPMLAAEERSKPALTRAVTAAGGLWQARDVARLILRRAGQRRFTVAPGLRITALVALHSLLGPALRSWQIRLDRRLRDR